MLYSIVTLLVNTAAGLLGGILLLRFWMQAIRVRPHSSIAPFLFQSTDWLLRPLRRAVPAWGGYDWASLIGAFLIALLASAIKLALASFFSVPALLLLSVIALFHWIIYGFIGLVLIAVIFSWVNPNAPLAPFIGALTDPLLRPLRRIIPLVGNLDLSPLVLLLLLQVALQLVNVLVLPLS